MKNTITFIFLSMLALIGFTQPLSAQLKGAAASPYASTVEKPIYYYIESAATTSLGSPNATLTSILPLKDKGYVMYSPAAVGKILYRISTGTDNELWTIVNIGGTTYLKNKATGFFSSASHSVALSSTDAFISASLGSDQYSIRNNSIASFTIAWNNLTCDRWNSATVNTNTAWFFIVAPGSEANYTEVHNARFKTGLSNKIAEANALTTNSVLGNEPGQFSITVRTELSNAITAAQGVYDNEASTDTQFEDATVALNTAINTYKASASLPITSTEGNDIWYFFQGQRPANTYMTSMGAGAALNSKPVIPDDTQLWKIVANTNGTANGIALVNKVTGEYLNADAAFNTAVNSVATMPTNNLKIILSDVVSNGTVRFWVEHSTGSTPAFRLHAGTLNVMNWNGNAYDNSTWLIASYSNALKGFLQAGITNANAVFAATSEGSEFGQYPTAARTGLSDAIATAQGVYNNASASDTDKINATVAINAATATYKGAMTSYSALLSSNSANYKWYWIRSNSTNANAAYSFNKVISQGERAVGAKFTFEAKAEPANDAQLFRFELNAENNKVASIINKLGNHMTADGTIAIASTAGNEFTLNLLTDNISFSIKPTSVATIHAQEAGMSLTNWAGDAGTASAWLFDFAVETSKVATALDKSDVSGIKVSVANRMLVVSGTTAKTQVYTITGSQVDASKELNAGIYIVKVENKTFKVNVR